MIDTDYNTNLSNVLAEHVKLTRRVDTLSDEMENMDREMFAGKPVSRERYAKSEQAWQAAYDERTALEDRLLAEPIEDVCAAVLLYRCRIIARIAEHDPRRGASEFRRLAGHVDAAQ